jgi:hypothetical protein
MMFHRVMSCVGAAVKLLPQHGDFYENHLLDIGNSDYILGDVNPNIMGCGILGYRSRASKKAGGIGGYSLGRKSIAPGPGKRGSK